jgi:hypothetical protein
VGEDGGGHWGGEHGDGGLHDESGWTWKLKLKLMWVVGKSVERVWRCLIKVIVLVSERSVFVEISWFLYTCWVHHIQGSHRQHCSATLHDRVSYFRNDVKIRRFGLLELAASQSRWPCKLRLEPGPHHACKQCLCWWSRAYVPHYEFSRGKSSRVTWHRKYDLWWLVAVYWFTAWRVLCDSHNSMSAVNSIRSRISSIISGHASIRWTESSVVHYAWEEMIAGYLPALGRSPTYRWNKS